MRQRMLLRLYASCSDGTWRWDRTFGGASVDVGHGVAVDGDGNVLVSGQFGDAVDLGGGARTSAGESDAFALQLGCACSD